MYKNSVNLFIVIIVLTSSISNFSLKLLLIFPTNSTKYSSVKRLE